MRSLNWSSITASADGDFQQLPAGGYVARIVDMVDNEKKEYVELVLDIAEGEFAGRYSDKWGQEHPYAHHLFLSYKDTALPMLKGRLETIQASNSGFDPFAAWDAGRLDMFRGRLLGINLQEEEYESTDGKVRTRMNVCQVIPVDDVRQGKVRVRDKKTLDGVAKPTTGTTSAAPASSSGSNAPVNEDDIPF
jgi:hypothetical protein